MKLLQLNIWQGRLMPQILKLVETVQPDILCLQEVFSSPRQVDMPDNMFSSFEALLTATGFAHSYFSPVFGVEITDTKAEFGNAIISRFPLQNLRTVFTEGSYLPSINADNYVGNTRNLQLAEAVLPGGILTLANHHAHWEKIPLGLEVSVEKMKAVAQTISELPRPLILSGDMNVVAESATMQVFNGMLRNLTAENQTKTTLSQLGKASDVACDHILVSQNVQVTSFKVADDLVSDHKALLLEFEI